MVKVTLEPGRLVAEQDGQLTVVLTNNGPGVCTNITLVLRFPGPVALLQGATRISLPRLDASERATHTLRVRPKRAGTWPLTSANFSYRDASGRSCRSDAHWDLTVLPAEPDPPASAPAVVLDTTQLGLRKWDELRGRVVNNGRAPLHGVTVRAHGPVTPNPTEPLQALGDLPPGGHAEFQLAVRADESGNIPLYIEVTSTDPSGRLTRHQKPAPVSVGTATTGSHQMRSSAPTGVVLFLAADPTDASRLRLGQEHRDIKEQIQLSKRRDHFELHQQWAVRTEDVSRALLEKEPEIVHFSGHGTSNGEVCFEDKLGNAFPVPPEAFAELFALSPQVRCVVLNACYSEAQADAIADHVGHVIGMKREIGDEAAIAFSVGFYQAVAADRPYKDAYSFGCNRIQMLGLPEHLTPTLHTKT